MTSELKAWPPKQIEMLAARHRIIYQTRADFVAALNEYAASRRAPSPAVARLVETLKSLRRSHYINVDDPWYSCPAATGDYACSNDNAAPECDCGADRDNKRIDDALAAVEKEIGK